MKLFDSAGCTGWFFVARSDRELALNWWPCPRVLFTAALQSTDVHFQEAAFRVCAQHKCPVLFSRTVLLALGCTFYLDFVTERPLAPQTAQIQRFVSERLRQPCRAERTPPCASAGRCSPALRTAPRPSAGRVWIGHSPSRSLCMG
jgi:hypothetical protein